MADQELPWTEKYRPDKLEDVVGHKQIVERLETYAKKKNMPHMLFAGPAGVGKTVCAVALGKELFGKSFNQNFLELNASDERGIDIIRGKIKDFAAVLPYGGANFKIIFLDEADSLTRDAQAALRRTMEKFTRTCRFILSCNYSSRIIDPIQSRSAVFRFKPLSEDEIVQRLEYIAKKEHLHVSKSAFDALVRVSEGDMRKAINFLQTASALDSKVNEDTVYKVASRARPKEVQEVIDTALKGDFLKAREKLYALLYEYGMSGEDVIKQLHSRITGMDLPVSKKAKLIDRIGEYSFRMVEGANERIQLEALIAWLVLEGAK